MRTVKPISEQHWPSCNPKRSPWGTVQVVSDYGNGYKFVSTAGHGGVKLDRKRNAMIPEPFRREGGWYEEDCEWAIAHLFHQSGVDEDIDQIAVRMLKSYFWNELEQYIGGGYKVHPSESWGKREFLKNLT